MIIIK
jgi:predicted nucleotide-binding protein